MSSKFGSTGSYREPLPGNRKYDIGASNLSHYFELRFRVKREVYNGTKARFLISIPGHTCIVTTEAPRLHSGPAKQPRVSCERDRSRPLRFSAEHGVFLFKEDTVPGMVVRGKQHPRESNRVRRMDPVLPHNKI